MLAPPLPDDSRHLDTARPPVEVPPPQAHAIAFGRYRLVPLQAVHCDDVAAFLGLQPGVYVANAPEPAWYARFGGAPQQPLGSMARKHAIFARMAPGSFWLSGTLDRSTPLRSRRWTSPAAITHLGCGQLRGRAAQLWLAAQLCADLVQRRHAYAYCLVYNVELPQYAAVWLTAAALRKKLILDYEDDYTTVRRHRGKNALERWLRRRAHGAICIAAPMRRAFAGRPTCVVNSFAKFDYLERTPHRLRPGMRFIYAGRHDDVGGVCLLPALTQALAERLGHFELHVAGSGPLAAAVREMQCPHTTVHGYVSDARLRELIDRADAALVLQAPDTPFSTGSYPSKIDTYAAAQKPIFVLQPREA